MWDDARKERSGVGRHVPQEDNDELYVKVQSEIKQTNFHALQGTAKSITVPRVDKGTTVDTRVSSCLTIP